MKRVFSMALALCLVLCACGNKAAEGTEGPSEPDVLTSVPVTEPTTEPTTAPTEPSVEETAEPTEPPLPYANPLTGEPLAEPVTARTFAVVINNIRAALPQHGVSQADVVYEILAEGGITRCLALFSDISDVEKVGPVRSARTYFIDLAEAYNAILVHAGGSSYAYNELASLGWDHLDGVSGTAASYYYRDQERLSMGYALEHTLFTSGPNVIAYATQKGMDLAIEDGVDFGLSFAQDAAPAGENAETIVVHFRSGGKTTTLTYDSGTGLYSASEYDQDYMDGNTGRAVTFRNVLVLLAKTSSDGYRMFADLVGSGKGYFACGGKIVPIQWSRASTRDPFVYTLEDGTPITLGIGSSYIGIVPTGSPLDYE